MDLINSKILAKLSHPLKSSLFQIESPFDDYELDPDKLWTPYQKFQILENSFRYFSTEELFSGILFCKSKKPHQSQWFRARFYRLYKDRLVLYSVNFFIFFFRAKCKYFRKNISKNQKELFY